MPRGRSEKTAVAKPPKALVQIIWDDPLIKFLLKLVKANPSYRQALFPSGNARISASRVTPEICIELFKEKSKPWLKDAIRRGLLIREEGVWKPTVMWNSSFNDPVVTKTNALRSEYAKTCKTLKPMKVWKKWSDVESRITRAQIQEACPYFFELRELLEADNDGDSDVEIPGPLPLPPAKAARRDTPPSSDDENSIRRAKRPRTERSYSRESSTLPEIVSPPRKRRSQIVEVEDSSDEGIKPVLSTIRRPGSPIASVQGTAQVRRRSKSSSLSSSSSDEDESSPHSTADDVSSLSSSRSDSEGSGSEQSGSSSLRSSSSSGTQSYAESPHQARPASEDNEFDAHPPKWQISSFLIDLGWKSHYENLVLRVIKENEIWMRVIFRGDERPMKRWEAERDVLIQVLERSKNTLKLDRMAAYGLIEKLPSIYALDKWTENYANPVRAVIEHALRDLWLWKRSVAVLEVQARLSGNENSSQAGIELRVPPRFEKPRSADLLEELLGPCSELTPELRKGCQWMLDTTLSSVQHPLTYLRWARENQLSRERVPPHGKTMIRNPNSKRSRLGWKMVRCQLYIHGFTSMDWSCLFRESQLSIAVYWSFTKANKLLLKMPRFLEQTNIQFCRSILQLEEAHAEHRYAVSGWTHRKRLPHLPNSIQDLSLLELCELVDRILLGGEVSKVTLLDD